MKNNTAAKRSREAKRMKENQISLRTAYLEEENARLKSELGNAIAERDELKKKLKKYEYVAEWLFSTLNLLENVINNLSRLLETTIEWIMPIQSEILAEPIFIYLKCLMSMKPWNKCNTKTVYPCLNHFSFIKWVNWCQLVHPIKRLFSDQANHNNPTVQQSH